MRIELMQGDCLDLMWRVDSASVDAIICDLPYGTTACTWDVVIPFEPLWAHYKRIIKPRGAVVLFGSQPFTSVLNCSNLGWFKYEIIWEKCSHSNPMMAKKQILRRHENISVFYDSQCTFNPQMEERAEYNKRNNSKGILTRLEIIGHNLSSSLRQQVGNEDYMYPGSIQKFNKEREALHPVNKPLALLEYLIKTYTNEGDTVMDNCFGSCTTGVAAVRLGRHFIGIEKDEHYFNVGKERIEAEQANIESTLFYHTEKQQPAKPTQPTLFADTATT